jgi:hypothetical protein
MDRLSAARPDARITFNPRNVIGMLSNALITLDQKPPMRAVSQLGWDRRVRT